MSKLKTFFTTDWKTRRLAIKIFLLCGITRVLILTLPFKKLQIHLGKHNVETAEKVAIKQLKIAREIGVFVEHIADYTPWQSKCLVRAIVAQYLLRKKGIATTLYLGVAKSEVKTESKRLKAHAWLRCGSLFVTGGQNIGDFKVISKFSNENQIRGKNNSIEPAGT